MATQEARRLALQEKLDAGKNRVERNRMGQFATPPDLALEILRYAKAHFGETGTVRFLDPAVGTGSFYSALLNVFPAVRIESSVGYEIDTHYGIPAAELWRETGLDVRLEDFTKAIPPSRTERFNLLICNPPYVRHHHIAPGENNLFKPGPGMPAASPSMGWPACIAIFLACLMRGWKTADWPAGLFRASSWT